MYQGFRRVLGALTVLLLGVTPAVNPQGKFLTPAAAATVGSGECTQTVGSATSVTVTQLGNDCVVTFGGSETETSQTHVWTPPSGVNTVWLLAIGGGGAGGSDEGGGGGAGLYYENDNLVLSSHLSAGSIAITVGSGGTATNQEELGENGADSVFGNITADGGGAGGQADNSPSTNNPNWDGQQGGSGGGNADEYYSNTWRTGNAGATVATGDFEFGNAGGRSYRSKHGGGGGGAGAPGNADGTGGAGKSSTISGTAEFYAAGGGGGRGNGSSGGPLAGGSNIGGTGGNADSAATSGDDGTGSGGGGSGSAGSYQPGDGGDGIVIVRYTIPISCETPIESSMTELGVTYTTVAFTAGTSCEWNIPSDVSTFDLLIVAGGGAGGSAAWGGGGGAGEVVHYRSYPAEDASTLTITVGEGGRPGTAGLTDSTRWSYPGSDSSVWNGSTLISADGGGQGTSYAYNEASVALSTGGSGGSGGGATEVGTGTSAPGGSSTKTTSGSRTGYGNAGGSAKGSGTQAGGGGGGAGAAGTGVSTSGVGGAGGTGTSNFATWLTAIRSSMDSTWQTATATGYIAAGGGGGGASTTTRGAGGTGGGGNGGIQTSLAGADGVSNTGSGGGGASYSGGRTGVGGNGGSGLVIIRYFSGEILRFDATNRSSYSLATPNTWTNLAGTVNATRTGDATFNTSSKTFSMDGNEDYFDIPDLQIDYSNGLSIHVAADFGAANNFERLIDFGSGSPSSNYIFYRMGVTDDLGFALWDGTTLSGHCYASGGITSGMHTYSVVIDPDSPTECAFYRDGVALDVTYSDTRTTFLPARVTTTNNWIGKSNWSTDSELEGSIRYVSVYNTVNLGPCIPTESTFTGNGTIGEDGVPYKVVKFTAALDNCKWVVPAAVSQADLLVVGGGGAGGSRAGGGGGAGEVDARQNYTLTPGATITVNVGAGGVGVGDDPGTNGSQSSFDSVEAPGGGGGGGAEGNDNTERDGRDGASGGGSSGGAYADDSVPGEATSDLGFAGGKGRNGGIITAASNWPGGGGGGSASVGQTPSTNIGGNGGGGTVSTITGASVCYGAGGGGGIYVGYTPGTGGSCTGLTTTAGAGTAGNVDGASATSNSGSGGGGSGWAGGAIDNPGGYGGSGVVIIRYVLTASAPTITTVSAGNEKLRVTFSAPTQILDTITDYEYSVDGSTWNSFGSSSGGTKIISGLTNGTAYTVRLRSVSAGGNGLMSTYGSAITPVSSLLLAFDASDINSYESGSTVTNLGRTGSSNNGTITGSGTISVTNQAFNFPDPNTNTYIDIAGTLSSNLFQNGYTIDFYAAIPASANWTRVLAFGYGNGNSTPGIGARQFTVSRIGTTGRLSMHVANEYPETRYSYNWCNTDNAVFDSTMKRYTVTVSDGDTCAIYVNGTTVPSSITKDNSDPAGGGEGLVPATNITWDNLFIGKSNHPDTYQNGDIRSIRVFTEAFTPTEIDAFNSGELTYSTVTFDSNGGTDPDALITSGAIRLPAAGSRTGYTFAGWYSDDSTFLSSVGVAADSYSPTTDLTIYAKWAAGTNTVTFSSNYSGGPSNTTQSITTDQATALSANAFSRTGYSFNGWATASDGSGTTYTDEEVVTLNSSQTLYAQWTVETYTVTWDSKGGTSVADGSVNYGANLSLPSEPTKSGYRFLGWSATDGGSAETFPYAHPNSADFTMYALWTVDNYTVSFQAGDNGSGSNRSSTKIHGTALTLPDSQTANGYFTRAGYGIVGWSENADGSTTDYALGASYTANAGDTLYPVWELNSCVVNSGDTYVNSGSSSAAVFGSSSSMIFKNASSSTSNSYNRAGYLRFEYDPSITWDGATLQVTVNSSSRGNANSFYNGSNNFQVKVYATGAADWDESTLTFNSANASSADWGLNTGTFPWAIDNGTLLGTIDIPTSTSTIGVSYGLSNAALDSFLNADSDGEVTFFLVRSDTQSQPNLGFATKDQTTYSAPTLLPHPASCAYTITYNKGSASGAGGSDNTATKIQGTGLTLPDSTTANNYFTRTGYTVTDWATNADGTGTTYAFGATYTAERNQTLYPVWTPDTYTVTYTYNGATGGNSTASEQYTVDSTVVALPTPAKTGYTFVGWYAESGLTTLIGIGGASYTPAADATLYAKWSAATFTVVYDYNGATGGNTTTDDDFTTGSGSPITLPTPTRTGYTFGGWYSDAALTSSVGAAGASYSPSVNLTVYAKWTADSRSVTYVGTNKTSGSVPTDGASYIIGNSVVVKANSGGLVRTGYDFAGWTENSDGSGTVLEAGDTVTVQTSDITLYAKWTAATYTITYHANGGSGTLARATDTFTTGNSGVTLPGVGSLTKTGYDFGGWSTTPTGSALVGAYSTSQDRTLYAVWTIKSITYSYAKGSDGDGNSLSSFGFSASFPTGSVDDFGTSVTLSSSVDASIDADANGSVDHQFFGWSDGTTVYDAGDTYVLGETNPTFTAQWIKVFSVRYALAGGSFAGSDSATDSQCIGTDDTCTDGQIISLNSRPSRAGYTFLGWEDQSGTVKSAAAVTTITSSSYLFTAKWDPIDYTLNFNSLGGSNVISDYTQNIGDIVTIPDPGSKTGYSFGGWSDGSTLYGIGGTYTVGASGASFSAQWVPDVYTVTYDWQGGSSSTPDVSDTYTVGTGDMSLATASGSGYARDGYTFSGWATSVGGLAVSGFQPTADDVLYAVWADGNYTLSYDGQGGTVGSGLGTVPRTTSVTLPTPVRSNFTFVGWYDASSGGNLLGAGGASFTPTSSQSLYARWVQDSLYGVDLATLETANTYTASNSTSTDTTISHAPSSSSARVQIPAGALPAGTVVTVRYFKDTERATDLISDENTYFFSLLVSWLYGSGSSATVPDTAAGKPITVTLTNSNIKAGAMVYQVIGETVTELARATVDGSVTVELTEDPEVVVAATKPSAPTSVSGTSGDTRVSVSWTAGSSGGSPITGYTVTASPGGATCSTASTSCTINSLTNNTAYTFTVTAQNALGASTASTASSAVTPVGANYAVTFDANGGSSVSAGSFFSGSTVSAPSSPSRSGYTFEGWSTTLDDDTTEVTFPYAPGVTNAITLYALWEVAPAAPSRGNSGRVVTPPVRPTLPITPARPTVTVPVVTPPPVLQAPVASPVAPSVVGGSSQAVVGGQSVATETTQRGNSGVGVKAGNVEVGIGVKTPSPNSRVQSNPVSGNPELVVAAGEVATVNGKGLLPGSTVQFWLPGADSRELGRVTVLPDGSINADVSLANSPAEPPLPIGRQVLQLTGYDEQGNLTVIDTVITIGQGAPAPERLRETDQVPDLQPGQTLATSAGAPETVRISANAETRQVSIESDEWSFTVTVPESNGTVNETAPGAPTVQFRQASTAVVDGEGFQPDTRVDIFLFSDPTLLGSFTVAEDGTVTAEIYLDKRFATVGDHTLQIQGVGNDGYVKAANLGVLVEEPPMETTAQTALSFVWWIIAGVVLVAVLLVVLVSRRRRLV